MTLTEVVTVALERIYGSLDILTKAVLDLQNRVSKLEGK